MSALDSPTIKSGEWHDGKHRKAIPLRGGGGGKQPPPTTDQCLGTAYCLGSNRRKAAQCDHADGPGPKMRSWRCSTVVKSSTLLRSTRVKKKQARASCALVSHEVMLSKKPSVVDLTLLRTAHRGSVSLGPVAEVLRTPRLSSRASERLPEPIDSGRYCHLCHSEFRVMGIGPCATCSTTGAI
ncbi:uncharacterized protein BO96DRAFT_417798 [Aspergillus niger CBS 101883]|uniref:Uncharacterized protein n=2 Tax=Aspergillus TaxID=5052 RepID=A0A370PIH9_ASPPH|nr:uncharacterized protein BO96DRAFT_417798 [Aspergillus niger CBS 101883]PYH62286.1 hypothetical protein BO96DRAFT_417798 [Aspergillus niger CBS 101883]RDH25110.1 hypothetical protein M747DRAFT_327748 [Aspergillus niger ATCC 13496]RDK41989.1 hypothetical protein M752DRAFT_327342 [Aspergillus phoenicis ATCC 13157]